MFNLFVIGLFYDYVTFNLTIEKYIRYLRNKS